MAFYQYHRPGAGGARVQARLRPNHPLFNLHADEFVPLVNKAGGAGFQVTALYPNLVGY